MGFNGVFYIKMNDVFERAFPSKDNFFLLGRKDSSIFIFDHLPSRHLIEIFFFFFFFLSCFRNIKCFV